LGVPFRNIKDTDDVQNSKLARRTRSKSMENFTTDMESSLRNEEKRHHERQTVNKMLKNCATHQSLDSILELEVDTNFGNHYQVCGYRHN
jgi:hypothetical protein